MAKPYERLKGESVQAFSHFVVYRDMGLQRSQRKTAAQVKINEHTISLHATKWKWQDRALMWDRMIDARSRKAQLDAVEQMQKRHIAMSQGLQNLTARELQKLIDKSQTTKKPILKPEQLARLMQLGMDSERLSRGEPTEIVAEPEAADLSNFTLKDLRSLKRLKDKLGDE